MVLFFILLRVLFIFKFLFYVNSFRFCTFHVFLRCFGFSWGCSGFFGGCSWFSWECSGFLGGVPGFSGVPECSVMFRCSGVPVFRVPVFLEILHAPCERWRVLAFYRIASCLTRSFHLNVKENQHATKRSHLVEKQKDFSDQKRIDLQRENSLSGDGWCRTKH